MVSNAIKTPAHIAFIFSFLTIRETSSFLPKRRVFERPIYPLFTKPPPTTAEPITPPTTVITASNLTTITSPLRFIGPYPTLSLRFPQLSTPTQREKNATGVSLDFVLDTAANTNTINAAVAEQLGLERVGRAPAGVGAGGALSGGDTFLLGDCELEDLVLEEVDAEVERFTFMSNLSASALPIASPSAAGLLSVSFLNCFAGGVMFQWGEGVKPSVSFLDDGQEVDDGLERVEVQVLPIGLPCVTLVVNGVEIPALFDTGSPISVMNRAAATAVGIEIEEEPKISTPRNPFARIAQNIKDSKAASQGDSLMIAGANGERVILRKMKEGASMTLGRVSFGDNVRCFVGDLPGLAALDGLGLNAPPAAILGMDLLLKRPKVVYKRTEVFL